MRIVALSVACLLGILLTETLLRISGVSYPIFHRADETLGLRYIPGARGWHVAEGKANVEINSQGWRDVERTEEKSEGTYRVAVLGDSYVAALQVPLKKTFCYGLQDELKKTWVFPGQDVEVLNFGCDGYGTGQAYLLLRHDVWRYSPDLVLLAILTGNDIHDNHRELKQVDYVPYFIFDGDELKLDDRFRDSVAFRRRQNWLTTFLVKASAYSRILQVANHGRSRLRAIQRDKVRKQVEASFEHNEPGMDSMVYKNPPNARWEEAWRVTEELLRLMRDECRRKGVPFAIVTLSNGIQVHPDPSIGEGLKQSLEIDDLFYPDRRIKLFGIREDIPVLNLAPFFRKHAMRDKSLLHGFGDNNMGKGHWNEKGHRLAGILISRWLRNDILPVRRPLDGHGTHQR